MNRVDTLIHKFVQAAAAVADITRRGKAATWDLCFAAAALRADYPDTKEGREAFYVAAMTAVPGLERQSIRNYADAADVWDGLTDAQRVKMTDSDGSILWPYDSVLALKAGTKGERTRIIGKAQKEGTTNTKRVRAIARDVRGTTKQGRKPSADVTITLAELLREKVDQLVADGHSLLTLIAGAQLAQDHEGDVATALLFIAANPTPETAEDLAEVPA